MRWVIYHFLLLCCSHVRFLCESECYMTVYPSFIYLLGSDRTTLVTCFIFWPCSCQERLWPVCIDWIFNNLSKGMSGSLATTVLHEIRHFLRGGAINHLASQSLSHFGQFHHKWCSKISEGNMIHNWLGFLSWSCGSSNQVMLDPWSLPLKWGGLPCNHGCGIKNWLRQELSRAPDRKWSAHFLIGATLVLYSRCVLYYNYTVFVLIKRKI